MKKAQLPNKLKNVNEGFYVVDEEGNYNNVPIHTLTLKFNGLTGEYQITHVGHQEVCSEQTVEIAETVFRKNVLQQADND